MKMINLKYCIIGIVCLSLLYSCGKSNDISIENNLPNDFSEMSDTAKVVMLCDMVEPDSLAHIICNAELGRYKQITFDQFDNVVRLLVCKYDSTERKVFLNAFDNFIREMPASDRAKIGIRSVNNSYDKLGLHIIKQCEENYQNGLITEKDFIEEVSAYQKILKSDTTAYNKFMIGIESGMINSSAILPQSIVEHVKNSNL